MIISTVFTGAIAILALVGGSIGKLEDYVGCETKYTGILNAWNYVDDYLKRVDSNFCTVDCPCYFKDSSPYLTNPRAAIYYGYWNNQGTQSAGATAFQNCTAAVRQTAVDEFFLVRNNPKETNGFKPDVFADYWEFIEKKFNCSGWCKTNYEKTFNGVPVKLEMYKYMFSDIGRFVIFLIIF